MKTGYIKIQLTALKSVQNENTQERSIATSVSSAILDCSPPASNSIKRPIRNSTPNTVIFTELCDRDLSNKTPTILTEA